MRFFKRQRRRATVTNGFRRPALEPLEIRALLSVGAIELGPSDNIALDQPRVAVELLSDVNPDPAIEQWESVGPGVFNTFLLDTGANSVLAMATAVSDMIQPPLAYQTEGEFVEVGVGGDHPMDVSASYRFDFAGTSGIRNTLLDTRILSDADNDFSMFGPWGLVGMPAMAQRVTSMDMRGWSGGGVGLDDLYMKVAFSDELPAGEAHRYALSVDNRLAFDPVDYLVSGEPPVWADIPFLTAIPTQNGVGAEGTFLFDTGAQISLISQHLAMAIGLDSNGDGLLDQNDSAYLGSETIGGVGGQTSVPVFAIDEIRVPVTQVSSGEVVELVWTDLQWLVLDIEVAEGEAPLDGVFGSDLLTSGWFYSFFTPGMPDGYIDQVHLDFRDWGLYDGSMPQQSGTIYFDLNPAVDQVVMPGPGIRLQETARSTEVFKGVSTDTYTLALETVPLAPVEITITADPRTLVSADGGATFASTLILSLNDRTARTITVAAVDDGLIEGPQTGQIGHTVASADPDYNNMPVRDVTVRILDNRSVVKMTADQAGQQAITSIEVAEGEQATYWIQLTEPAANEMWVLIEEAAGQATVVNPNNTMGDEFENVWLFSSGNWSQPQPVRLTAVDDTLREGPHQTQLVHTLLDLGNLLEPIVGQNLLTVQIIDDDLGGVLITETAGGTQLAEGGATDAYQIALATIPTGAVQITMTADSQTEVSADGGATFASTLTLTFNDTAARTISVRAVDDDVDEGTHGGRITHAITGTINDPMYPASLPIAQVTATITDNDTAGISITGDPLGQNAIASISVVEGDDVRYWLKLTSQPKHDVTIYLDSTNGQVAAVDDAHAANAFLKFTPANWNVPQAVRASAIDEGVAEGPHADYLAHDLFSIDPKYQGTILLTVNIADPLPNAVPLLVSLSATPSPITRPGQITLAAGGVSDSTARAGGVYRGEVLWASMKTAATAGRSPPAPLAGRSASRASPPERRTTTRRGASRRPQRRWSRTPFRSWPVFPPRPARSRGRARSRSRPVRSATWTARSPGGVHREVALGVDEDGSDGWAITLGTDGWPLGEQSFSARCAAGQRRGVERAGDRNGRLRTPFLLAGLSATPSPVTRPGEITLAAGGVSDPDGTVARVEFYRGEVLLGVDEDGSDGWAITLGTAGWPLGEQSFSAWSAGQRRGVERAGDCNGGGRERRPAPGRLSAPPSLIMRPGEITLTAGGVSDPDGTVARVEFYRGEVLLGVDEDGSDGWAITWAPMAARRAELLRPSTGQRRGVERAGTATAVVENAVPLLVSLSASPSLITRPGEITLAAGGVSDPDGTVARVEFYRGEVLLGVDEDGSDGWAITLGTAGWPLGEQSFSAWSAGQRRGVERAGDRNGGG